MLFITHRQLFLCLALLKPYETLVHSKAKFPDACKGINERRDDKFAPSTRQGGERKHKQREEAEKVWLVFFFSWLFFRVTGSGKMCEMLLTISFNFKLISANCLAVNAAESHALPGSESHRVSPLLFSSLPSPRRVPFPFFAVPLPLPATGIEIFTVLLPQFAYARQTFATGSCTITTQAATTTAIQLSNFRIFKIHSKRYAASSLVEPRRRPCHRIRCNIKVI